MWYIAKKGFRLFCTLVLIGAVLIAIDFRSAHTSDEFQDVVRFVGTLKPHLPTPQQKWHLPESWQDVHAMLEDPSDHWIAVEQTFRNLTESFQRTGDSTKFSQAINLWETAALSMRRLNSKHWTIHVKHGNFIDLLEDEVRKGRELLREHRRVTSLETEKIKDKFWGLRKKGFNFGDHELEEQLASWEKEYEEYKQNPSYSYSVYNHDVVEFLGNMAWTGYKSLAESCFDRYLKLSSEERPKFREEVIRIRKLTGLLNGDPWDALASWSGYYDSNDFQLIYSNALMGELRRSHPEYYQANLHKLHDLENRIMNQYGYHHPIAPVLFDLCIMMQNQHGTFEQMSVKQLMVAMAEKLFSNTLRSAKAYRTRPDHKEISGLIDAIRLFSDEETVRDVFIHFMNSLKDRTNESSNLEQFIK